MKHMKKKKLRPPKVLSLLVIFSCRKAYSYQATSFISRRLSEQSKNATTDRQRVAGIRKKAFDSTMSYIESHIFNNEEVIYCQYVKKISLVITFFVTKGSSISYN